MRPALLNPLFAGAGTLKGVGERLEATMGRLTRRAIDGRHQPARIVDLLFHLPSGVIDRSLRASIDQLHTGLGVVTLKVVVAGHRPPPAHAKRSPYRVEVFDDTGTLTLVFFHAHGDYLRRILPEGETRFVSGRIEFYNGQAQMVHPDHVLSADEFARMPAIEAVYPMTAGLSPKSFHKAIEASLARLPALPEWQDAAWIKQNGWPAFADAVRAAHQPASPGDIEPTSPARQRLAYDELLASQLALALVRQRMKRPRRKQRPAPSGKLFGHIASGLPFQLTGGQWDAIGEIRADMAAPERMLRLLQGDVGAGKTVVAAAAIADAVETGGQAALMAPTDLLARQHLASLRQIAGGDMRIEILTGREKGRARDDIIAGLASGQIDVLIGTHALFQPGVSFANLALVVIDEQHRFGVHQRLALQSRGHGGADVLVMTATPIPRTLALAVYGDMDVSRLTEKPAGRKPIDTRVMPLERLDDVIAGIARQIEAGARVYWVCPLVEESDVLDVTAAEQRHAFLSARLPGQVGLVHGRMKAADKDRVMSAFASGDVSVLVATTVIEVGVDVPEATIMVIENAERFGLAQLHQLRGRIGRADRASTCILLYQEPLGETAHERLRIMRQCDDGFIIAEQDLKLRGAGDVLGARQSGLAAFRLADLAVHGELLAAARDDAQLVLGKDGELAGKRGEALRILLYLFERDAAVRLIGAG